jgi:hypothetical protein
MWVVALAPPDRKRSWRRAHVICREGRQRYPRALTKRRRLP